MLYLSFAVVMASTPLYAGALFGTFFAVMCSATLWRAFKFTLMWLVANYLWLAAWDEIDFADGSFGLAIFAPTALGIALCAAIGALFLRWYNGGAVDISDPPNLHEEHPHG